MTEPSETPSADPPCGPEDAEFARSVYDQLRLIARQRLSREGPGHTLQATALVNEAYLKLSKHASLSQLHRGQFFAAAAEAMRRILIDHARTKHREKRGGGARRALVDVAELSHDFDPEETLALNDAICRLEMEDPQAAQVVKLRFFAGLSVQETSEALQVSERTVKRDWQFARAWLFKSLQQ
ncbi:MAG TPA: ECF-type sigma factor [Tepidisphaeraceae bacterium]|nr:ECF-type sigma factor [Tepidisphaeraceae bacterium]